jgi:hypothetical protein
MDADRRGIWRSLTLWNRSTEKNALYAVSRRLDQRTGNRGQWLSAAFMGNGQL